MAEAPARAGPTLLTTSAAAIYTAGGAGTWTIVRFLTVCNEDTVTRTFTLGINTAATDASGKRTFAKDVSIPAGTSWHYTPTGNSFVPLIGHASTPDLIYGLASATSALTVTIGLVTGP